MPDVILCPPDLSAQVSFLKEVAESNDFDLPDDVAMYIAREYKERAISEMRDALISVMAFSTLTGKKASVEMARWVLHPEDRF